MNARVMAPEGLAPGGLSEDQRLFFSEHGWLVVESVIDESECERYIERIDRANAALKFTVSDNLSILRSPAGSIVMFSESTIHSAAHVVSERTRYAC